MIVVPAHDQLHDPVEVSDRQAVRKPDPPPNCGMNIPQQELQLQQPGGHCSITSQTIAHHAKPCPRFVMGSQRSARHGEQLTATVLSRARTCKRMSRWCDQSIHDAGHSDRPNGLLRGRTVVGNPGRGNHLGQCSCANAPKGRTYGRKRSDQMSAKDLARRGPSTCGSRP
jgi:hypothetical protein